MTHAEALRKAKVLFGKTARIRRGKCYHLALRPKNGQPQHGPTCCMEHGAASGCPGGRPWYEIGSIQLGMFFMIEAGGDSWKEAFQAYDAKRDREKMEFEERWGRKAKR